MTPPVADVGLNRIPAFPDPVRPLEAGTLPPSEKITQSDTERIFESHREENYFPTHNYKIRMMRSTLCGIQYILFDINEREKHRTNR